MYSRCSADLHNLLNLGFSYKKGNITISNNIGKMSTCAIEYSIRVATAFLFPYQTSKYDGKDCISYFPDFQQIETDLIAEFDVLGCEISHTNKNNIVIGGALDVVKDFLDALKNWYYKHKNDDEAVQYKALSSFFAAHNLSFFPESDVTKLHWKSKVFMLFAVKCYESSFKQINTALVQYGLPIDMHVFNCIDGLDTEKWVYNENANRFFINGGTCYPFETKNRLHPLAQLLINGSVVYSRE